jgi:hypothetical protein
VMMTFAEELSAIYETDRLRGWKKQNDMYRGTG